MQQCKHCDGDLTRQNLQQEQGKIVYRDWETDTDHVDISEIPPEHDWSKINIVTREYLCPSCRQVSEFVYRWRKLKSDLEINRSGRDEFHPKPVERTEDPVV